MLSAVVVHKKTKKIKALWFLRDNPDKTYKAKKPHENNTTAYL